VKVLVCASFTPSLINFRGSLLRAIRERGHDVLAAGPERDEPTLEALDAMDVRFERVVLDRTGLTPLRDVSYLRALTRLVRSERPDAVLTYTIKPNVYGMLAARFAGVPMRAAMVEGVGYAFGTSNVRQRLVGGMASLLYRVGLSAAHVVFFLNPDDRRQFGDRGLVRAAKTRLIAGTGVDLDYYRRSRPPDGPPVFLLIARLIREKGVEDYVAAARELRRRAPQARFQLLGPFDPHPDAISRARVEAWEAEGAIEYLGVVSDVRPYLAQCSVFVLPSYYREGLPRTAMEALATGRAIVTTDVPGCRETVEPGHNGLLVPPRDPVALSEALATFLDDPVRISAMGEASASLAERRFDVRIVNRDILDAMGL
jgi:glycosyltransferase involved in cell wall biosynthesis